MNVSREYTIEQLKSVRKSISDWIKELEKPIVIGSDGKESLAYGEEGSSRGLFVGQMTGIPSEQLQAEMGVNAQILAALASSD